ncbi:uncharacterized protein V6R79_018786 [Siganus canaliculatus]
MDRNTYWLLGVVLLGTALSVNSQTQKHSLFYTYTALSKPSGLPGIHDFTAMGLLDDRMIDYFDSSFNEKIPRQPWMRDNLPADYWEKGTKSRKSKHQWFKVNLDILMKRMRQNDTDSHVLQWQHGCEGEVDPSTNELKFVDGKDRYSYDGHEFLYFDNANDAWVAPVPAAQETKRKWDEVQVLKEYTKGYLEKECMKWLTEFTGYETKQLKQDSKVRPPEVYVFAKDGRLKENVVLTCFATGFLPKEIELLIKRDGRILTMDDGVRSSGSRPNDDETYQRKDWVEILKSDKSRYSCEVIHAASAVQVETYWDHKIVTPPEERGTPIAVVAGAIVVVAVVAGLVGVVVVFLRRRGSRKSAPNMAGAQLEYVETPNGVGQPLLNGQGAKDSQDTSSTGSSGYNSTAPGTTPAEA